MTIPPNIAPSILALLTHLEGAETPKDLDERLSLIDHTMQQNAYPAGPRVTTWLRAGEILIAKGQYVEAEKYLHQALPIARELALHMPQAQILGALAEIFRARGDYRVALTHLLEAETQANESGDYATRARVHLASGLNHVSLGLYEQARQHFYNAYMLYAQSQDVKGKTLAANRIGTAEMMLRNFSEAEKYLAESLQMSRQQDDRHATAGALVNLGEIQRRLGHYPQARDFLYEAATLFSALGVVRGRTITEINLGHLAVLTNDLNLAKYHYLQALGPARQANLLPQILDLLAGLTLILKEQGLDEEAARLVALILSHPARLEETEEFLAPVKANLRLPRLKEMPFKSVDDLLDLVNHTFQQIFQEKSTPSTQGDPR